MPARPTGCKRWMLAKCTLLGQQTLVAVLVNVASSFCSRVLCTHQEMANLGSNYTSGGCKTPEMCGCMCASCSAHTHVTMQ